MLERDGIVWLRMYDVKKCILLPIVAESAEKGATVHVDEVRSFNGLAKAGYKHWKVNHGIGMYVDKGGHVNNIEGFWSWLKLSIAGTNVQVFGRHLWRYLKELEYRYIKRKRPEKIFSDQVSSF